MNGLENIALEFVKAHPEDAAKVFEKYPPAEFSMYFNHITPTQASILLKTLPLMSSTACIEALEPRHAAQCLQELSIDISSRILRRLNKPLQDTFLSHFTERNKKNITIIMQYPENSAGAILDPNVVSLPQEISIKEAKKLLKVYPTHYTKILFIVDRDDKLVGIIDSQTFSTARSNEKLAHLMNKNVIKIHTHMHKADILYHPGWQSHHTLPVVDKDNVLVGILRYRRLKSIEREYDQEQMERTDRNLIGAMGELFSIGVSGCLSLFTSNKPNKNA